MIPDPPNNHEAETGAIGACLVNPESMSRAACWLTPPMHYQDRHAVIWRAMLAVFHRHDPVSTKTVYFELKKTGDDERVGGIEYLSSLTDRAISTYIETYAAEVERCYLLRQLISAGGSIAALGYTEPDAETAIGSAHKALSDVAMRRIGSGLLSSGAAADLEYERIERANSGMLPDAGVLTGYCDLDQILLGLHDGDVTILAARPSMGKTALLLGLAHGVARNTIDRDVLIFSLEMSEEQLRFRRLAMLSRIDTMRIRSLQMTEAEQGVYMDALGELSKMPIYVDDTGAQSVSQIRSACHRHIAERGRQLAVFVDYLQLMTAPEVRDANRVQVVGAISRGIKALAKELHCPIVALSQLSRAVEGRQSHVPMLSDLRETGDIEQDADVVMFIYRDEVYDKETEKRGIAELHIAKHRNGPIGVVPLRFDAATTRFDSLSNPFGGPAWQA